MFLLIFVELLFNYRYCLLGLAVLLELEAFTLEMVLIIEGSSYF